MLVSDVKRQAITTYFNDTGTSLSGAISDQMIFDFINESISDYWAELSNQEFGYYQIRQSSFPNGSSTSFVPINIVAGTSIYSLTNQSTTTNTTSQSVSKITKMFLRTGTSPIFNYQEILPVGFPTDRYYSYSQVFLSNWNSVTGNATVFQWSSNIGGLDGNGNPTLNIEFSPSPGFTGTCVFDGVRYPAKVAALTDTLDLPEHLHQGVVFDTALNAAIFDKAEWPEMEKKKEKFDQKHLPLERRSIQAAGPLYIKNVSW